MNRATVVYLCMLVTAIAGLWALLALGKNLTPPEDLAGKWAIKPQATAGEAPGAGFGSTLSIDQSGKFFQFAFANGPRLKLQLTETADHVVLGQELVRMSLEGSGWEVTVEGVPDSQEMVFKVVGPRPSDSGQWIATRTARTFPSDISLGGGH